MNLKRLLLWVDKDLFFFFLFEFIISGAKDSIINVEIFRPEFWEQNIRLLPGRNSNDSNLKIRGSKFKW